MQVTGWISVVALVGRANTIYVDPIQGDDTSPTGQFTTPYRTIQRAQVEVQAILQSQSFNSAPAPIDVILRGGTYYLSATLEFGPFDSGLSNSSFVTYKPYCDPLTPSDMSILPYPYAMGSSTPLRYMWNGVGSPTDWRGPDDPLLQLGVNISQSTIPPRPQWNGSTSTCVDKINIGHTCYTATSSCVSECMAACIENVDKRVYSERVYDEFYLLFGRDLKKEEECVESCSVSCTTCEKVVLTGMKTIQNTAWTLASHTTQGDIYMLDLSSHGVMKSFTQLFVNGVQLPVASYPDVQWMNSTWQEQYASILPEKSTGRSFTVNSTSFTNKTISWTGLSTAQIQVLHESFGTTWHFIHAINGSFIELDGGGGQLGQDIFYHGPEWSSVQGIRVENVLEELDAPGEWYFNEANATLYIMPLAGVDLAQAMIEIPQLKQLIRLRGTPGIDVGYSIPGHDTLITAAETETADPMPQELWARNIRFDGLIFRGTLRTEMELCEYSKVTEVPNQDIDERIPGHKWSQSRIGAIYMESAAAIEILHCNFIDLGGNGIFLSGRTQDVNILLNHFHQVGSTAIAIVPKSVTPFDPKHPRQFLNSRRTTISYNQIHDYGLVTTQSAAVLVAGTSQTTVYRNLVYSIPKGGVSYSASNADGDGNQPDILVRPLETAIHPPETLASTLGGVYTTVINMGRIDRTINPLQAKIIGGPECPPASGRIGALYGQQHAGCSDCCPTTQGTAGIRNNALGMTTFGTIVQVHPGTLFDLQVEAARYFDAPVDVFVGFHLVTPNRLVELPSWRFQWRVRTRFCSEQKSQTTVSCGGPCGCHSTAGVDNMPSCESDYDPDPRSLACAGPYQAWSACQTGSLSRILYFNCTLQCYRSICI